MSGTLSRQIIYLNVLITRCSKADSILLVHIGRLKISESLPDQMSILLLIKPDLYIILGNLVTKQQNLFPPGNWPRSFREATDSQVTFCFWKELSLL